MKVRYIISEKWPAAVIHEVIDAVTWGLKYFNLNDPKDTLTVKLITGADEELEGTADRIKNRRYEIRIKYDENYLEALFHEITHIKQFVYDGLRFGIVAKWKGQEIEKPPYLESPWEMEARAMEAILLTRFRDVY